MGRIVIANIEKPVVVIFFNDWKVYPEGVNAGGGESATLALAKAIQAQGYRVVACANLPTGEGVFHGIEFWNFGESYELRKIEERLQALPAYHCICATLVHPLLLIQNHQNCLSRILINHAPSARASGLEPTTLMNLIDKMVCVSNAQRALLMQPDVDPSKIVVIRNGFDPDVFDYAGPEERDWNQLIYIGRVEPPKGIHVLLEAFSRLKPDFPELKLSVFGDERYWPDLVAHKEAMMARLPNLRFHGKVPQRELAKHLQRAGLLVFPSVTFESAGLAVVDAQASGCPVVGFGVGGVPEYLTDGLLGKVIYERTTLALYNGLRQLLADRTSLMRMSENGRTHGRTRPWGAVAREVMAVASEIASQRLGKTAQRTDGIPRALQCIRDFSDNSALDVLEAHQDITCEDQFPDGALESFIQRDPTGPWVPLVKGIRHEQCGELQQAAELYMQAAQVCDASDWQPFFRLALLCAECGEIPTAAQCAQTVLTRVPDFHLRSDLEKLIQFAE